MTVLSLPDAKTYLRVEDVDLDDPGLLPAFISAAVKAVERIVGPLEAQTITERVTPTLARDYRPSYKLVLNTLPVLTLTSVTAAIDAAPTLDLTGHYVDALSGVVSWSGIAPLSALPHDVVYRAGRAEPNADPEQPTEIDADLLLAVKAMLKELASSYRTGKRRSDTVMRKGQTPTGFDNRAPALVEMLCGPHRLPAVS